MKKVAAGIIVGLLLGLLIGYQFAPRTDTGELEETIDQLLEEVDAVNDLLQSSQEQVEELEAGLIGALADLDAINNPVNITDVGLPDPPGGNATFDPPQTVVYQLQNYDLDALEAAGADLYIIDYS